MIYFVPKAGLGNRMRGIASAYRLAEHIHEQLTIIWINNHECNCSLQVLFSLPKDVKVIDFPWIPVPLSIRMHIQDAVRNHYSAKCDLVLKDDQLWDMEDALVQSMVGKRVYLESAAGWDCEEENAFDIFEISEEISRRANRILEEASVERQRLIGIHIRRTDLEGASEESPREAFEHVMQNEVDRDSGICFYLASDDETEKTYFVERFGKEHVITHSFLLNREKPEGIKGAVTELLLLGSGGKVYGSKGSSFSQLAATLSHKPLIIVSRDM